MHDTIIPSAMRRQVGCTDLLDPFDRARIFSGTTHLWGLRSPRLLGEVLIELAETSGTEAVLDVLARYRRLTPEMVAATGADRFPPLLQAVKS